MAPLFTEQMKELDDDDPGEKDVKDMLGTLVQFL
jgi:hypothetical protein